MLGLSSIGRRGRSRLADFLDGMASIGSIFGTDLGMPYRWNHPWGKDFSQISVEEAAALDMAMAWQEVGDHLRAAMGQVAKEHNLEPPAELANSA